MDIDAIHLALVDVGQHLFQRPRDAVGSERADERSDRRLPTLAA